MQEQMSHSPSSWEALCHHLEDQLHEIEKDESSTVRMASRSLVLARNFLHDLQNGIWQYQFHPGEEVLFYKEIKPFFIGKVIFYSRLFKIETDRPPQDAIDIRSYYSNELKQVATVYSEHRFIHRYLEGGLTHLDEKLFFRPEANTAFALTGFEPPADGSFNVCYDHVVGELNAADQLRRYLLAKIDDLALPGQMSGNLPKITWTAPIAHLVELVYALYACGVFNNGKAPLKDIFECVEVAVHAKAGNFSRIFQELLYRKAGPTVFLDVTKNNYLLYIQRIEDKHIK